MDIAKSETFKYFTILNMALLFLIKVHKTAVQSIPMIFIWVDYSSSFFQERLVFGSFLCGYFYLITFKVKQRYLSSILNQKSTIYWNFKFGPRICQNDRIFYLQLFDSV